VLQGVSDAVNHLMEEHPDWYVVNGVALTPEMGREMAHRHLHWRFETDQDGGQACPLGPCDAGSQCTWDLDYHPHADPVLEGACAPESILRTLSPGPHTIAYTLSQHAHRTHISLSWRPYVVHRPVLPLDAGLNVLLLGPSMDSLARLAGGWTLHWQGAVDDSEFPVEYGQKTVLHAFEELYDVGSTGSVTYQLRSL
jgi:hypothetical protein